ncbi:MAG: AraC family transcriptional regulator [Victivallales bacterium]
MKGFKHFFATPVSFGGKLMIRGVGIQERMPPCIVHRPAGTGDFLLMYFYETVEISSGGPVVECPEGTLMIWRPGELQHYGTRKHSFKHTWIHCDGTLVESLLEKKSLVRAGHMQISSAPMERYLTMIYDEICESSSVDEGVTSALMTALICAIARERRKRTLPGKIPDQLLKARNMIESGCETGFTLHELAEKAGYSVPHFSALFKKHFHTSPIEYLIRARMNRAAYLLRDSNRRIGEVAALAGYDDIFHFSKLFKKHFGKCPREFSGRRRKKS